MIFESSGYLLCFVMCFVGFALRIDIVDRYMVFDDKHRSSLPSYFVVATEISKEETESHT